MMRRAFGREIWKTRAGRRRLFRSGAASDGAGKQKPGEGPSAPMAARGPGEEMA